MMRAPLPQGEQKARAVRTMFDGIARRYDLVNRIMTFGLDVRWRKRATRALGLPAGSVVLDLACGTGDFCRELARGDLIQSQELVFVAFDLSLGHSRRQVGVGALELPLDDALDHGEREALLLERADAPDPQQVLTVVDRDPALSLRRGEKALRLVVADRVDGDVARCGKLLDPISHDSLLYE